MLTGAGLWDLVVAAALVLPAALVVLVDTGTTALELDGTGTGLAGGGEPPELDPPAPLNSLGPGAMSIENISRIKQMEIGQFTGRDRCRVIDVHLRCIVSNYDAVLQFESSQVYQGYLLCRCQERLQYNPRWLEETLCQNQ